MQMMTADYAVMATHELGHAKNTLFNAKTISESCMGFKVQ
jgi:hypothetical protein